MSKAPIWRQNFSGGRVRALSRFSVLVGAYARAQVCSDADGFGLLLAPSSSNQGRSESMPKTGDRRAINQATEAVKNSTVPSPANDNVSGAIAPDDAPFLLALCLIGIGALAVAVCGVVVAVCVVMGGSKSLIATLRR